MIEKVLRGKGLLLDEIQQKDFERFFLERLIDYVSIGLLEGKESIPYRQFITHFEDLRAPLPNLAHLLYYYSLKSHFKKSCFFQKFSETMRSCYEKFYSERRIHIAVKCGLARTEEIGLSKECEVNFHDFAVDHKSKEDVTVIPKRRLPFLKIQGVSKTNGFTQRPHSTS